MNDALAMAMASTHDVRLPRKRSADSRATVRVYVVWSRTSGGGWYFETTTRHRFTAREYAKWLRDLGTKCVRITRATLTLPEV